MDTKDQTLPPQKTKRLLVDMSVTLLHHGHIRLLKRAREAADERGAIVVVGLTSDTEVLRAKGYTPELRFAERKEILLACRYVDEVVETPWLLTEELLADLGADYLFHGEDNSNPVQKEHLIVVPRTREISSTQLHVRSAEVLHSQINRRKVMLTPGPGAIPFENAFAVQPLFGRGDADFAEMEERVFYHLRRQSGLPCVARLQGSASLALEVAARSFVSNRVLVVNTGYYCERLIGYCRTLEQMRRVSCVDVISAEEFLEKELEQLSCAARYDWIISVYTETSTAMLNDVPKLAALKKRLGARLFLDATASIGLEQQHDLADVIAFSSCKGLGAMTGGAFICYQDDVPEQPEASFYLNIRTHLEKKMTGPYHPMAALDRLLPMQDEIRARVRRSKEAFAAKFSAQLILPPERQPLLATRIRGKLKAANEAPISQAPEAPEIIFYAPRTTAPGESVVCHLGELHRSANLASEIPLRLELDDR